MAYNVTWHKHIIHYTIQNNTAWYDIWCFTGMHGRTPYGITWHGTRYGMTRCDTIVGPTDTIRYSAMLQDTTWHGTAKRQDAARHDMRHDMTGHEIIRRYMGRGIRHGITYRRDTTHRHDTAQHDRIRHGMARHCWKDTTQRDMVWHNAHDTTHQDMKWHATSSNDTIFLIDDMTHHITSHPGDTT